MAGQRFDQQRNWSKRIPGIPGGSKIPGDLFADVVAVAQKTSNHPRVNSQARTALHVAIVHHFACTLARALRIHATRHGLGVDDGTQWLKCDNLIFHMQQHWHKSDCNHICPRLNVLSSF
jgi:hypothetical protein